MRQFRSHKAVEAFKIGRADMVPTGWMLSEDYPGTESVIVSDMWLQTKVPANMPPSGGYFVKYADNYTSWSPAKAFEDGYTEILGAARKE